METEFDKIVYKFKKELNEFQDLITTEMTTEEEKNGNF